MSAIGALVACPLPSTATGAPTFDPSTSNCTVPPAGTGLTVVVNVTAWPKTEGLTGLAPETVVVVVVALLV